MYVWDNVKNGRLSYGIYILCLAGFGLKFPGSDWDNGSSRCTKFTKKEALDIGIFGKG